MKKGRKLLIAALIIITAATALRTVHLLADPPVTLVFLTNSGGIYFDEAIYCHNARNKILYGKWVTDEWNPIIYSFILHYIYYVVFLLFGIGMAQIKLVHVIMSFFIMLLFFLIVRRLINEKLVLPSLAAFSFSFIYLVYHRIGLVENVMTLLFLASFYTFLIAVQDGREKYFLWNGFLTALAFITKYYGIYFVIANLIALLYVCLQRKERRWAPAKKFAAGFIFLLILWFFLIFLPFKENYFKIGGGWTKLSRPPLSQPLELLKNLDRFVFFRYYALMPLLLIAAIFFVTYIFYKLTANQQVKPHEVFVFFWLLIGSGEIGILYYHPLRYFLPIIAAFFLSAALALDYIFFRENQLKNRKVPLALTLILLAYLTYKAGKFLLVHPEFNIIFFFQYFSILKFYSRWLLYLNLVLIAALIAAAVVFILRKRVVGPKALAGFAIALFLMSTFNSLYLFYRHFLRNPEYKVEYMADYVKEKYGKKRGIVFFGLEAPRLIMKTRIPVIFAYKDWYNDKNNPFERYKVTHLVDMRKFHQLWWVKEMYPEVFQSLELEVAFPIWDTWIDVYRLDWWKYRKLKRAKARGAGKGASASSPPSGK